MSRLYKISAPICLLTLVSLQSSYLWKEAPIRVGKTLFITLDPQSPSFAAFDDSRMKFSQDSKVEVYGVEEMVELQAGRSHFLGSSYVERRSKNVRMQKAIRRELSGLTISLSSPKAHVAKKMPKVLYISRKSVENRVQASSNPLVLQGDSEKKVVKYEKAVKHESQNGFSSRMGEWGKTEQNLVPEKDLPKVLVSENSLDQSIYIQSQVDKNLPTNGDHRSGEAAAGGGYQREGHTGKGQPSSELIRNSLYELSGSLEMTEGLAFTGVDTHLSISRVVHGQVMDKGDLINVEDGIYKILASDLKGHIVAKLQDTSGHLLGLGEFDLYQLPDQAKRLSQIDKLHITIKPYKRAVASLFSGTSFEKHEIPADQSYAAAGGSHVMAGYSYMMIDSIQREINRKGASRFSDDGFLLHSSFILRAEKKNHWGSLAVGVSGRENAMRIYPDSMVRALLNSQDMNNGGSSVIWGRVTQNGEPVKGAKVELAGDFHSKPIYFNTYIPDVKLESTETDGLFAFVGVSSGIQAIRATINGKYISTQVIPTEENYVSYLEIEMDHHRSAGIAVYDGQTHEALRADVQIYGTKKVMEIDGLKEEVIHFPGGPGLMMIEVDGGDDYLYSRHSIHRLQRSINLPLVRANWLEQLETDLEMDLSPDLGVIIGYVDGSDYDVFVDQGIAYDSRNIVYFDKQGRLTYDSGKEGGGFVLFNVPTGMHTVTVLPKEARRIFTQVSVVGADAVNVISVNL